MIIDKNFRILSQTNDFILGNIFEKVFLIKKLNDSYVFIDEFYGDPGCGIIDTNYNKCLIGGEKLMRFDIVTSEKNIVKTIQDIYDLRKVSKTEYEILTDPWRANSAIWKYDLITNQIVKISDFTKYQNQEHSEEIKW